LAVVAEMKKRMTTQKRQKSNAKKIYKKISIFKNNVKVSVYI